MSYEYSVGTFSRSIVYNKIISLKKPEDTEILKHGDHVEQWGHLFEWDEHCLTASQLQPWRIKGDPLCDNALEELFSSDINISVGRDLLECVLQKAAENPSGHVATFLTEVSRIPPEKIVASSEEMDNAQRFYLKNSVAIMQSLNYFTLAGGFASPGITRVLHSVSYLVNSDKKEGTGQSQASKDKTYSRLAETFQFVLDVMGCSISSSQDNFHNYMLPGGDGWKAVLRVRLLHGVARRRALKNLKDSNMDGAPINQEDLAGTLGGFCMAPIWCLPRQYPIFLRNSRFIIEEAAFVALWRHVGFYLGVDSHFLLNHFSSPEVATKSLISIICHVLPSNVDPNTFNPPTVSILQAIANRPPFPKSFEYSTTLSRKLLGNSMSTHLGLPTPTKSFRLKVRLMRDLFIVQLPVLFGQIYPRRGWDEQRLSLTKMGLGRLVRFQLGFRRTSYRPRNERGELDEKVSQMEHSELEAGGRERFVKGWRNLMIEMTLVISFGILILGFGLFHGYRFILEYLEYPYPAYTQSFRLL